MDEIDEVRRLMDPPPGLREETVRTARRRLMATVAARPSRRLATLVVTGVGMAAAAALALAVAPHGGGVPSTTMAAWTVDRSPTGLVTVTIRQLHDPQGLQRRLAAAGVPALIQFGAVACAQPAPVVPGNARLDGNVYLLKAHTPGSLAAFAIRPSAIPAGYELDFTFPSTGGKGGVPKSAPTADTVAVRLIPVGKSTCGAPVPTSRH